MFKTIATSVILFLACFAAAFGQSHVPTLGSNNAWTGNNSFLYQHFTLNQGNSCGANQAMVGYQADFTPICATFSGSGGVTFVNGVTGNVAITNTDGKLTVTPTGQNIVINCPGCGGGGGSTTPGGSTGAIQYNAGGTPNTFGGVVITGLVWAQGASAPRQAIAGTDFQVPVFLACSSGVACPLVGNTYQVVATGSAGTGDVSSADFGQAGGYAAAGTTISGLPGVYSINPAWSLTQINALMSRFNTVSITACSVNSNIATLTGLNSYSAGQTIVIEGLSTCSGLNNTFASVSATGLSQSSFEVAFSTGNVSGSEAGYSFVPNGTGTPNQAVGLIVIPPGLPDNNPSTILDNSWGRVWDARAGYGLLQASQFGVQCGIQSFNATLTMGSNLVTVGASLNTNNVGQMAIFTQSSGYGNTGTQSDWEPYITNFNTGTLVATLSGNAPFSGTVLMTVGTNNQVALQRAMNYANGIFPVWLPQCGMLTDTVRWNGTSIIGQQMNYTTLEGIPARDILQQQDFVPITAWSINASAGTTTFTIPAYAAHSILPASLYPTGFNEPTGDKITLQNFPTSTFFNNVQVTIASQPTPTTIVVNNVFGQGTSSATESGDGAPTTQANVNGARIENTTFALNNAIDGTFTYNHYDKNAALTVEPPYYRPALEFGEPTNNPFAPGWGVGVGGGNVTNGVALITQNSALICVPTTLAHLPVVGSKLVFPYQGGMATRTVSSTAGSCSAGYAPFTLSAALPNTSGYTATQAEWFDYGTTQTLSVAMAGTISFPYTVTVNLPIGPVPFWESNVSTHGHIIIGDGASAQEWDYMGVTFGGSAVGGTATFILRNGPTTVNSGSGWSIGSTVFPLNPCQAMYHNPYPVIPTINGALTTPVSATFYAGICLANAAISLPSADGRYSPFNSSGLSLAHFIDVVGQATTTNALGNANNNGSTFIWEQGDYTGYGNTFDDIRVQGYQGGFMQGPASVNQFGVAAVGPTSTGQSIKNCTFRTGYSIALTNMEQSNIDRCDTYSTEVSPYDGTSVGASTDLYIGYTLNEKTGGGVTNVAQFTVKDYNGEPENGNHDEFPPSVESQGTNVTWIGNIFEGGFNIFGGSFQQFHGTNMAGPVFNYGSNNYFEKMYGTAIGYNDGGVYNGSLSLFNWGSFSTCEDMPQNGGPNQGCGADFLQSWNGHDAWATMMGNLVHPNYNILGGVVSPDEFGNPVFDNTELWYGRHFECAIGSSSLCIYVTFASAEIPIGPFRRITDTQTVLKANVKLKTSGTATFRILLTAQNGLSNSCTPNFSLAGATFTATSSGWTAIQMPVDFTGYAGCTLGVQLDSGSATNTLEVGYFNFVPYPTNFYLPGPFTHTPGSVCSVVGQTEYDSTHIWVCAGSSFGAGTWKSSPLT